MQNEPHNELAAHVSDMVASMPAFEVYVPTPIFVLLTVSSLG